MNKVIAGSIEWNAKRRSWLNSTQQKVARWFRQRLFDTGIYYMADSQSKESKGLHVNLTTIILGLMFAFVLAIAFMKVSEMSYEKGKTDARMDVIEKELKETKSDAKTAKEFGIKNAERQQKKN